jgi:serpin B
MLIVLPKTNGGLPAVEGVLTEPVLRGWAQALRQREVEVALPKFKFTASFQLNSALQELGMRQAFDSSLANFAGINGRPDDLYIGAVVHKAFVEVNEKGTEAAAATGVVAVTRAALPQPVPTFRADHPFLFMIRDRVTGSLLFLGRVADPTAS